MSQEKLNLDPNFDDADAFYAALNDLLREASDEDAERINARLVLLLANHIGSNDILAEAMEIAGRLHQDKPD